MKNQLWDFILILILLLLIYIKDAFYFKSSQIKEIETIFDINLTAKLNDYNQLLLEHNLAEKEKLKCITRVKNQDIDPFYDQIIIYNNHNCNLKKGDYVLNNSGLIGTVESINNMFATVNLITNKKTHISIRINNNYGILTSHNGILYVEQITNYKDVLIGDKVYTSDLSSIPPDIVIGTVKELISKNDMIIFEIQSKARIINNHFVSIYGG